MTSKRTAASKRAALPRASDYARSFLKDWERLSDGDFLLIYQLDDQAISFVRAGTHADLFGE
jgi:mRNA interferase YafQ